MAGSTKSHGITDDCIMHVSGDMKGRIPFSNRYLNKRIRIWSSLRVDFPDFVYSLSTEHIRKVRVNYHE